MFTPPTMPAVPSPLLAPDLAAELAYLVQHTDPDGLGAATRGAVERGCDCFASISSTVA